MTVPSFVILPGDADGNLGDSAILAGIVHVIRDVCPSARVLVPSDGRLVERGIEGIELLPKGLRGFSPILRAIAASNLVVVGGGGLFQDDDSLVKMPYWSSRCLIARALGRKLIGCSLGVGPLQSGSSRFAARLAFRTMAAISVRDSRAAAVAMSLAPGRVSLTADPALLVTPAESPRIDAIIRRLALPRRSGPIIAVSPRRYFLPKRRVIPNFIRARLPGYRPPRQASQMLIARYVEALRELACKHDATIVFLPTYNAAHEADDEIAREILDQLPSGCGAVLPISEPSLFAGLCARVDIMIAGRMHPAILAASVGTRSVGIAYNQKFDGFFEMIGASRSLLQIEQFLAHDGPSRLVEAVEGALSSSDGSEPAVDALRDAVTSWMTPHIEKACGA